MALGWEDLPQCHRPQERQLATAGPQALSDGILATNGQLEDQRWSRESNELLKVPRQISARSRAKRHFKLLENMIDKLDAAVAGSQLDNQL